MGAFRIFIADDHEVVRKGLCALLQAEPGWEICGEAADGREATEKVRELKPDAIILDIGMPGLNGIDATRQMVRRLPTLGVLILSMHSDEAYIVQALKAGARGYMLKDSADTDLIRGVEAVAAGKCEGNGVKWPAWSRSRRRTQDVCAKLCVMPVFVRFAENARGIVTIAA